MIFIKAFSLGLAIGLALGIHIGTVQTNSIWKEEMARFSENLKRQYQMRDAIDGIWTQINGK